MKKIKKIRLSKPEKNLLVVIIPLFFLNVFVAIFSMGTARTERQEHLQSVYEQIQYEITQSIEDAVSISDYLCMDAALSEFLQKKYDGRLEYYEEFNRLMNDNVIKYYYTVQSVYGITVVTDNPTISNGQYFLQEEKAWEEGWYQDFQKSGKDMMISCTYQESDYNRGRRISVIRKMEAPLENCIMRLEIDYSELRSNILNVAGDSGFYIVDDEKILFTNQLQEATGEKFHDKADYDFKDIEYDAPITVIGDRWRLYLKSAADRFMSGSFDSVWIWLVLLLIDVGIPITVINMMNKSKQERQALEFSKTCAELNALQSQMNPHFMFNTLESIRMHCVLNDEDETGEMLGKFSLLLRQASQWEADFIPLEKEIKFVEDYLEIQKFRFQDRLKYQIEMEDDCREAKVPKFGMLTFVENACVHGIERSVGGGCIFVRVHKKEDRVNWIIEDTGSGMDAEELRMLREKISGASMENLQTSSHIGILNIVMRLKLYYNQDIRVTVDSEPGQGTKIAVDLPF